MKQKQVIKEAPLVLDKSEEQVRFETILKNAKRISLLTRELEVLALDMGFYSKALSRGNFPRSHINEVGSSIEHGITELTRIHKSWQETFEEKKDD
jgi:hypothetical protein